MDILKQMIDSLKQMKRDNIPVEIYYAEDMEGSTDEWSVDVMNNILNEKCKITWTWTVMSAAEDRAYREEFNDDTECNEYEIVVDAPFSDEVVCYAILSWLLENGITDMSVKMIDFESVSSYSGYLQDLVERNIEEELENAVPLD